MQGKGRTKVQLASEVAKLRRRVNKLEALNSERMREEAALRQSEENYRLLVEGVKDYAIFMLDPDGRVATWNAGAENIRGYRAEEIVGQHFSCFYPPEDIEEGKPDRELKAAAAEGRFEDEAWRVRKDGSKFLASVLITALRDETGQVRGFSKVTRDITERKRAEEEIRRLNEELEERVAQQSRSIMELSTPVITVWDEVVLLPLIGVIDTTRAQLMMERLLQGIVDSQSRVAILDVTGVPTIDASVAQHLLETVSAAKMLGAEVVIAGIRPEAAQTMTKLGIDLSAVRTCGNLRRGIAQAIAMVGKQVTSRKGCHSEDTDTARERYPTDLDSGGPDRPGRARFPVRRSE